jgi:rsbT co-antagonist protein RsbR
MELALASWAAPDGTTFVAGIVHECLGGPGRDPPQCKQHGPHVPAPLWFARIGQAGTIERELLHRLSRVEAQREAIARVSLPVLEVWDGIVAVPVIGALDDERAARLSAAMLEGIALRRARFAILDLTGLEQVDAGTATILLRVCAAIRLLGTEIILCGLRSQVAKELVTLGSDLSAVQTVPTLRAALLRCRVAPR